MGRERVLLPLVMWPRVGLALALVIACVVAESAGDSNRESARPMHAGLRPETFHRFAPPTKAPTPPTKAPTAAPVATGNVAKCSNSHSTHTTYVASGHANDTSTAGALECVPYDNMCRLSATATSPGAEDVCATQVSVGRN